MANLEHNLFESPWLIIVGLVVVFAVLRVLGRSLANKKLVWASHAPLLLAGGVALLAHFVETDAEKIDGWTGELLAATTVPDVAAMDRFIDPGAVIKDEKGDQLATWAGVKRTIQRDIFDGHGHTVDSVARASEAGVMAASVRIQSRIGSSEQVHPTRWEWVWKKGDDGRWRVVEFHWVTYRGQPPGKIFDGWPLPRL
ncbi:MAG: hypothetical protein AAF612_03495 [Planctomycetota bacterium]